MKYQIKINRSARKSLRKISAKDVSVVRIKIRELAENPRPSGCKKLKAQENVYRIRVGSYRVLYTIEDDVLIITVVRIGDRKDVYR